MSTSTSVGHYHTTVPCQEYLPNLKPAERAIAEKSVLIKNMLEDMGLEGSPEEAIPINMVSPRDINSAPLRQLKLTLTSGQRSRAQEGSRMVRTPQERPRSHPRGGRRQPQEDNRHRRVGPEVHAGRPGDALRDHLGLFSRLHFTERRLLTRMM